MELSKSNGFTLIELSIVLVIIGLVIGGVLVGRDLIGAAKIRAQIKQIENFNTAINTFISKYAGLPGDLVASQATALGFTTGTGVEGDGDGSGFVTCITGEAAYIVDNFVNPITNNAIPFSFGWEEAYFWTQLGQSGLIAGSYTTTFPNPVVGQSVPITSFDGVTGILFFGYRGFNYYQLGVKFAPLNGTRAYPVFTPAQAFSIDEKLDDGRPGTGKVQSTGLIGGTFGLPNARPVSTNPDCTIGGLDSTTADLLQYALTSTALSCSLRIQAQ